MMRFLAVAGNSCLAISEIFVDFSIKGGRGQPAKQQLRRLCRPL